VEEFVDGLRGPAVDLRKAAKLLHGSRPDVLDGSEAPHQSLPPGGSYAGNPVQDGLHLGLAAQGPVVLDGEAVGPGV